jgi:hypothetical protein
MQLGLKRARSLSKQEVLQMCVSYGTTVKEIEAENANELDALYGSTGKRKPSSGAGSR